MNSKTFFNEYLENETDEDILDASYIIVSSRIKNRSDRKNICVLNKEMYPDSEIFHCDDENDMIDIYFDQLDERANGFLAMIILASIKDDANFIFLNTKYEEKLPYFKWLQEYVMIRFEYPVYEYSKYCKAETLDSYDAKVVKKKCRKELKKVQAEQRQRNRKTKKGRAKLMEDYAKMSKKDLKKELKKHSLYADGLSKDEMLDLIEEFVI